MKPVLSVIALVLLLASTTSQAFNNEDALVPINEIKFSLAVGVGEKTNPLVGGDDINLFVVPSLRYYGDKFFFDNGDVGYTLIENDRYAFSLLGRINSHKAYFSRWHPQNVFVFDSGSIENSSSSTDSHPNFGLETDGPAPIELDKLSKRKWALDLGIQANYYLSDNSQVMLQVLADANRVYSGFNARLEWFSVNRPFNNNAISIETTLGVEWLSAELTDYYYGLDKDDQVAPALMYQAEHSLNPYAKFFIGYQLSKQWKVFATIKYTRFGNGMNQSPLVEENYATTSFIGVSYGF